MTDHLCICAPVDTDRSATVRRQGSARCSGASRKRNGVANGKYEMRGRIFVFRQRPTITLNTRITTDWATGVISRSRNRWKYVHCVTMSNDVLNMPGRDRLRTSLFVLSHCSN
ncbi:hypothetical protein ALC56_11800 [Trachymyrmex septentrionalis]|uniref:Uncharacterized protein n=1 Tax=Trachymyrmex septentrionalis TaxID=34720 RepID=A0A195F0U5_9HYME|nr:hypothetical protein ALC56_11800 [Trachymyrmex septentrionalis]